MRRCREPFRCTAASVSWPHQDRSVRTSAPVRSPSTAESIASDADPQPSSVCFMYGTSSPDPALVSGVEPSLCREALELRSWLAGRHTESPAPLPEITHLSNSRRSRARGESKRSSSTRRSVHKTDRRGCGSASLAMLLAVLGCARRGTFTEAERNLMRPRYRSSCTTKRLTASSHQDHGTLI